MQGVSLRGLKGVDDLTLGANGRTTRKTGKSATFEERVARAPLERVYTDGVMTTSYQSVGKS